MSNERLVIQVDDAYIAALGCAAYTFASLEWEVVWCCERMQAGYIKAIGEKIDKKTGKYTPGKTAGDIAKDFLHLIKAIPDAEKRSLYDDAAKEFSRLTRRRNKIMHGKPGTTVGS